MTVCCVFLSELPHRGNSNEYTQHTIFNMQKKISLNYPKSADIGLFFQGTQIRVQNSHGKRAISVRAIEVLLYFERFAANYKSVKAIKLINLSK